MRAEIGVAILIGAATLVALLMLIYGRWLIPWTFFFTALGIPSPFALCFVAGMALYISDRKSFLNRRNGDKYVAAWLAILGFLLMAESSLEVVFVLWWMSWAGPSSWEEWMIYMLASALTGFVFLSGMILMSDWDKMVGDKSRYQPSGQRLDVETLTRYPRVLFAKYTEQYPHNPEGVLEWHIHKTMKEGKTREQAIKELRNVGDRSI